MKSLFRTSSAAALLAFMTTSAHAVFFFFIPGSVIGKVGDALTGAEGEQCVHASAKVGDVLRSPNGNTATIKSLSGTSSRCQRPEYPVRAALQFNYTFTSQAGIEMPEGFELKPVTDSARYAGALMRAEGPARMAFQVSARPKDSDIGAVANAVSNQMSGMVEDYRVIRQEQATINGMRAAIFESEGKNKGAFGPKFTYIVTVLEGDKELVVVNAWAPWKEDLSYERAKLRSIAPMVKGIHTDNPAPVQAAIAVDTKAAVPASTEAVANGGITSPAPQEPATVTQPARAAVPNTAAVGDRLRELEKLYKEGILSKQEYDDKKRELLRAL
jgi:hypothetical protein